MPMTESAQPRTNVQQAAAPIIDITKVELPPEIIKKIVAITSRGNDATVKRKKDGFKVYETKLVEK